MHRNHNQSVVSLLMIAALLLAALGVVGCDTGGHRQAEVAERGAHVMPFDLDQTMHHFEPTPDGGVQQVVIRKRADADQVSLIRRHLQHEADRFQRGDFSDPARIHGEDMPGLRTLADNVDRLEIRYSDIPLGGQIEYRSDDPQLIHAIHRWFEAQVSDHGEHATGDMHHQ